MSYIERKSRNTGAVVRLHDRRLDHWYGVCGHWEVECCAHGYTEYYQYKHDALHGMAHTDDWCPGCIEGWPAWDDEGAE